MLCPNCEVELKIIKVKVRQHVGCPASCGGIMKEEVAGQKCPKCGIFASSKLLKFG
jgi:hypothetical protein